jgi:type III restriction enzyme
LQGAGIAYETTVDGTRKVRRWLPGEEREQVQDLPTEGLPRYAFKMATGSGKTVVMAMAMIWSYFHKRRVRGSRLSCNFLLLAPNVIVFQRLDRDFGDGSIFRNLPLLPHDLRDEFRLKIIRRGDATEPDASGNLFFTNIHQLYESHEEQAGADSWVQVLLGREPSKDLRQSRPMLDRVRELSDLVVLNDEAHHVWDEDLKWHETLMGLHTRLRTGLGAWLDFSATPRDQNGASFPWVVCDYPLAQAVEDRIVKAPIVVHQVDRADPEKVTRENVIDSYQDWIRVALERLRDHEKVYAKLGKKPVLFIMAEKKAYADAIGSWLKETKELKLKPEEVLIIHTDEKGNVRESQVEEARKLANGIDLPGNKVRVVVSVLMLREGWDVQSVTVVLGLRPFDAASQILPEQAIGRGLRLLPGLGPDHTQTLEVVGTPGFEAFVRQLEKEGVGIKTTSTAPKPPVIIEAMQAKLERDIVIPLTSPAYERSYQRLTDLDPLSLKPIWERPELPEARKVSLKMQFGTLDVHVGAAQVDLGDARPAEEMLAGIVNRVAEVANLTGHFAALYPIVRKYVVERCFSRTIDAGSDEAREALRNREVREAIARYLAKEIGNLTAERLEIDLSGANLKLSQVKGFAWRRDVQPV